MGNRKAIHAMMPNAKGKKITAKVAARKEFGEHVLIVENKEQTPNKNREDNPIKTIIDPT
jgi:hypothetical protein